MSGLSSIRASLGTALVFAAGLAGCAGGSGGAPASSSEGVGRAMTRTSEGLGDAALAPLTDLNLRRAPIPGRLEAIVSPYEPVAADCLAIAAEVGELTAILGPDIDVPDEDDDTLGERAGDTAADAALGSVESAVTGFIPYRSLLRQATGASAHERRLRAAYERGQQRRIFLKGVGQTLGCAPPAAPLPLPAQETGPPIEFREAAPSGG
jgi:hypothetical protein